MSQKKGRDESLKALRSIVDWWTGGGAPDRKLKYVAYLSTYYLQTYDGRQVFC